MKNWKKRFTSLLLAIVMCLSLGVPALAAENAAQERAASINWTSWGLKAIKWFVYYVDNKLYSIPAQKTLKSDYIELSDGSIDYNNSTYGSMSYIDIEATSAYLRTPSTRTSPQVLQPMPDMVISVSSTCSFLVGLTDVIAVSLTSPDGVYVINQTLGMNGLATYAVNTANKMGTYRATYSVTKHQKWASTVRLDDFYAPSSSANAMEPGQSVIDWNGNKSYVLPSDAVVSVNSLGQTQSGWCEVLSVEGLYDQFWDEGLQTHVMRLADYDIDDTIIVRDTIGAITYEPEKNRSILEFNTKYGTAYWPFDGDLTDTYHAGDAVSFQFSVVEEYAAGQYTFESIDYFQNALEKLEDATVTLCVEDYVI